MSSSVKALITTEFASAMAAAVGYEITTQGTIQLAPLARRLTSTVDAKMFLALIPTVWEAGATQLTSGLVPLEQRLS